MPGLKRALLAAAMSLGPIATAPPPAHASGDWRTQIAVPDDLASYTLETGAITKLDLKSKPPLIQIRDSLGQLMVYVLPKDALVTIAGKPSKAGRLRPGQQVKLRWADKEGYRTIGTIEVLPKEKSSGNLLKGMGVPSVPHANLTRPPLPPPPPRPMQPAPMMIREPAPIQLPLPPRPVMPQAPAENQEIRR